MLLWKTAGGLWELIKDLSVCGQVVCQVARAAGCRLLRAQVVPWMQPRAERLCLAWSMGCPFLFFDDGWYRAASRAGSQEAFAAAGGLRGQAGCLRHTTEIVRRQVGRMQLFPAKASENGLA